MSQVVREPEHNVYGRFRVLRRADGKFTVHDVELQSKDWPPGWPPVFKSERAAREHAAALTGLPVGEFAEDPGKSIREWMAGRPHTAECRCKGCRETHKAPGDELEREERVREMAEVLL